ncbi:MAG TPA: lipid IV(A) 3-deoxy-D-manno-octulosonic acid transferase [Nevskiaceae bacterium]|nr:lipid IV(A) 3-deoxy-D-manno-octulosonic acid transferase [Nevskiaceae bacterium]
MRGLYTGLLLLLTPFILLRLWWRGRVLPAYRQRIGERFGAVAAAPGGVAVWVHAVSVGESLAALPLIRALVDRHGEGQVWVSTTTPTGSERVQAALGPRVRHSYAPYDLPGAVVRFLDRVRPRQVVVMETELWPNLFHQLRRRDIPLWIANARLSPRSYRGYQRLRGALAEALRGVRVLAQSEADAERFRALGAVTVEALGNLKFDVEVPAAQQAAGAALRARLGAGFVWVAASTHEGEEALALAAHQRLLAEQPQARLILVPRHPQRFEAVAARIRASGLSSARRSQGEAPDAAVVLLGDSMGEMFVYLAAADLAFVGGSLATAGGHNVLEPAALGRPVLFGPAMDNFLAARDLLLQAGAAEEVADGPALSAALRRLAADPARRAAMGAAGQAAVAANRGALRRLLERLERPA